MKRDSDTLIMVSQAHLYFVKRSISESIAMLPKFEKSIISAGVTNVPVSNYTYAGFFTCSIKLRGLLEYVYAGLWEYVLIAKDWF